MKKILIMACAFVCMNDMNASAATRYAADDEKKENVTSVSETAGTDMTWEFYSAYGDPTAEDLAAVSGSSRFGKKAAYFYGLFKDTYVTKEEVVPGDPTRRTVIRKPEIYNAVKNIEKALGKALKKHEITPEESEKQFCHVLKVSLAAIDSDTSTFEKSLDENRKDSQALLAIFQRVDLKNLY